MILKLFRRYMRVIVFTMIACFVLTLGAGLGLSSYRNLIERKKEQTQSDQNVATIGGAIKVSSLRFYQRYTRSLGSIANQRSPELLESLRLDAFNKTVHFTLMLEEAQARKIRVRRKDRKQYLDSLATSAGLPNQREVRNAVEQQGIPWATFLETVDQDIMVGKLQQGVYDSIRVNQKEIDEFYTEVKVRHILKNFDPSKFSVPEVAQAEETRLREELGRIKQQIEVGQLSFAQAAQLHSQDIATAKTGGDLGWRGRGAMNESFQKVAFVLVPGEISPVVRTEQGLHLILLEDRRTGGRPPGVTDEQIRDQLVAQYQQEKINEIMQPYQNRALEISDHWVKAARAKTFGKFDEALNEYRLLEAQVSYSPVPHYFMARLMQQNGKYTEALDQIKKAELKQGLSKENWVFPEIWIARGDVYKMLNLFPSANEAYDNAFDKAQDRLDIQEQLVDKYLATKAKDRSEKAKGLVVKLKGGPAK